MRSKIMVIMFLSMIASIVQCRSTRVTTEGGGWEKIFNGKDLENWTAKIHHYEVGHNYGDTFRAEEGVIKVRYDRYENDFNERFGHLYYNRLYAYFHLSLEYRFLGELHPGAPGYTLKNSGVMFHSQDPRTMPIDQNWPISIEMQFLAGLEKGKKRPTGNMCSPGTDVVYKGKLAPNHCINSSSETYFGKQWIKVELIVLGNSLVTHFINGNKVLQYSRPQMGGGVVEGYDTNISEEGKLLSEGFIALPSEGQPIDFRNIEIRNLKGRKDPKAVNYGKHFIKSNPGSCIYK